MLLDMQISLLAPELSAQFMTAPTGRPRVMRNLVPVAAADSQRCTDERSRRLGFDGFAWSLSSSFFHLFLSS